MRLHVSADMRLSYDGRMTHAECSDDGGGFARACCFKHLQAHNRGACMHRAAGSNCCGCHEYEDVRCLQATPLKDSTTQKHSTKKKQAAFAHRELRRNAAGPGEFECGDDAGGFPRACCIEYFEANNRGACMQLRHG